MNMVTFDVQTTKGQIMQLSCNQNMIDLKKRIAEKEQDIPFDQLIIVDQYDKLYSQTNKSEYYQQISSFKVLDAAKLYYSFQKQKQEIAFLQQQLNNKNKEIYDLGVQLQELQQQYSKQEAQQISQFENQIQSIQDLQQQEITKQKNKIQTLEKQLNDEQNEKNRFTVDNAQNQKEIEQLKKQIQGQSTTIKQYQEELQQSEKKLQEASNLSQQYQASLIQLQNQLNEINYAYYNYYNQSQLQVNEQVSQIQDLNIQLTEAQETISQLKIDIKQQKKKLEEELQKTIDDFDNQISKLKQELNQKNIQYVLLLKNYKDLEQQLKIQEKSFE